MTAIFYAVNPVPEYLKRKGFRMNKMLPRERIQAAMEGRKTDRIPLMCQMSIGHMLTQLDVSPAEFWFDRETFVRGLLDLRDLYDFDGILVSLHGHSPDWRQDVEKIEIRDRMETVVWKNGDLTLCPPDELPYYKYRTPRKKIDLENPAGFQLPESLDYIPVSTDLHFRIDPGHPFAAIEDIMAQAGSTYSVHGEITSPLDYLLDLAGYQEALLGLIMTPDACKTILAHFTELIMDLALKMADTGVDAIKVSSPFAGSGFISIDHYREFVLPYEKQIIQAVRARGTHIYLHTCGAIDDRLEDMFDSGVSGIECLDPPPLGNVELDQAFQRIGSRGFIKGNLDSVHLLLNRDVPTIRDTVSEILRKNRQQPGFILSTACSIAPGVEAEKIQVLRDVVEKFKNPAQS